MLLFSDQIHGLAPAVGGCCANDRFPDLDLNHALQDLSENMGMKSLNERLQDPAAAGWFQGIFPHVSHAHPPPPLPPWPIVFPHLPCSLPSVQLFAHPTHSLLTYFHGHIGLICQPSEDIGMQKPPTKQLVSFRLTICRPGLVPR